MNIKEKLKTHYQTLFDKHGLSTKSVGWSSEDMQNARFELLDPYLIETDRSFFSILDVGSGFCDLYSYLDNKGLNYEYVGIEQSKELSNHSIISNKNLDNAKVVNTFIEDYNFEQKFDFIVSFGSFSWYKDYEKDIIPLLLEFYNELNDGGVLICTLASTQLDINKRSNIVYHDPIEILNITNQYFSDVKINHYLHHEFAIQIQK